MSDRGGLGGARPSAVAFLLLVTAPGLLYAAGARPDAIDNRELTAPPPPSAVASLDPAALDQLDDHLAESVPGRDLAVRLDAWTELNVLRRSPNPDVVIGRDGWWFFRPALDAPCDTPEAMADVRREMERAAALVAATGRRWVTAVAPDKASVFPEQLPDDADTAFPCLAHARAAIETLETDPPTGYVPTWADLRAARVGDDPGGEEVTTYWAIDSHWTTAGSLPFVLRVAAAIDPALVEDATVTDAGTQTREADLSKVMGLPRTIDAPLSLLTRPGITSDAGPAAGRDGVPATVHPGYAVLAEASGGTVAPGRTVLWHDSFGELALPHLTPLFEHLVAVRRRPIVRAWVSDQLARSDTVVFQVVQRSVLPAWTEDRVVASLAWAFRDELPTTSAVPGTDGWVTVAGGADVVAVPAEALSADDRTQPLVLQVRDRAGRLRHQRDFEPEDPRVFDLAAADATGATGIRLLRRDGTPAGVSRLTFVTTGTASIGR